MYGNLSVDNLTSSTGGVISPNITSLRNRIINGAMVIDQRNSGASVTPTVTTYSVDRWKAYCTVSSKYSIQQNAGSVTPPAGFVNYLGMTSLSSYSVGSTDYFMAVQVIEGYNFADLGWGTANAKPITISFWAYSSLTGTFGGAITNYLNTRSYPFSYTISSANTWTFCTINIPGDTSATWATGNSVTNGTAAYVVFSIGMGSTYSGTAGSWVTANYFSTTGATSVVGTSGATFFLTGVQLEAGTQATSFDYRQYGTELALCQRYFVKDLQDGTQAMFLSGVVSGSTTGDRCGMRFPVTMRATPTATIGGTSNPRIYDGTNSPTITSIAANSSSSFGACLGLAASGGGLTTGRAAIIIDNNASFITYSSEL